PGHGKSRMVFDPMATKVTVVEETCKVIDWCDKCFMPNSPCEEDQQQEEEADDDNDDD
ncbi:hypothetical protein KI387_008026, partial [Taxus chinensis]